MIMLKIKKVYNVKIILLTLAIFLLSQVYSYAEYSDVLRLPIGGYNRINQVMGEARKVSVVLVNLTSEGFTTRSAPIGLYSIKGYLQEHFSDAVDSTILDMQLLPIEEVVAEIVKKKPRILGFSVPISSIDYLKIIIHEVKNRFGDDHMPLLVFGKNVSTFDPELLLKEFPNSICVLGEGELAMHDLVEYAQGKKTLEDARNIVYTGRYALPKRERISDLAVLGSPDFSQARDIIDKDGNVYLEAARGCPWGHCTFCSVGTFWGMPAKRYSKNPVDVAHELKLLYAMGAKTAIFSDEEFLGPSLDDIRRVKKLAELIIQEGIDIKFYINARVDSIYNEDDTEEIRRERLEAIMLLKKAGLNIVFLGVESGSDSQLKRYCKGASIKEAEMAINILRESDIAMNIGFIMFDPLVSIDELRDNVAFIKRNNILPYMVAPFNEMRVYKGSSYLKLVRNREIKKGIHLLDSYDPHTLSYQSINYEDQRVKHICGLCHNFFISYYNFFYELKSQVRFRAKDTEFLQGYFDQFKNLEIDLLETLLSLSDNDIFILGNAMFSEYIKKRDEIIVLLIDDIRKQDQLSPLSELLKKSEEVLVQDSDFYMKDLEFIQVHRIMSNQL